MSQPEKQQTPGSAKKQCSITSFFAGSPPGSKSKTKVEKAEMVSPPSGNSSVSSPPANKDNKPSVATTPVASEAKPKLASIFSTPKSSTKIKTEKETTPKLASIFTKPNSGTPKTGAAMTPNSNTATPKTPNTTEPKKQKTPTPTSINSTIDAVLKAATPKSDKDSTPKTSKNSTPKLPKDSTPKTPKDAKPKTPKEAKVKTPKEAKAKTPKEGTPKTPKEPKAAKSKENIAPKVDKENTPKIKKEKESSSPGGDKQSDMNQVHSNLILPTHKVKMIMKSCPDVESVPQESLHLITKATELFIQYLANEAQKTVTIADKLDYKALSKLVHDSDELEFLRETIPKKITWEEAQRRTALAEKQEQDLL